MQTSGGTSGQPSSGQVFLPPMQPEAANSYWSMINPMSTAAAGAFAPPYSPEAEAYPGSWAYPRSQGVTSEGADVGQYFLYGSPTGAPSYWGNSVDEAVRGAEAGAGYYDTTLYPMMQPDPATLRTQSLTGIPYMDQLMAQSFDPAYTQAVTEAQGLAPQMYGAGTDILAQGFDPQSALYNRSQQQLFDQSAAANAMSGLGSSPYGAGVTSNALGNFDINWQNAQLKRQTDAAAAAAAAFASGNQLPLNALAARDLAALRGASGYESMLGTLGKGLAGAETLGSTLARNRGLMGMMPYQTGQTIGQNAMNALSGQNALLTGTASLGNNMYLLPQQIIDDQLRYMGLGQTASQNAGNLQQQGFNQTAAGIGGLLGGANALFGSSGLFPLATMFSDPRLKENIERIGELDNGLPIYSFSFLGSDAPFVGLMADEVERVYPEAVATGPFGFKMVDYARAVR